MIFSNYNETFANIHQILGTNSISYRELKGQTTTRNKVLEKFKKGGIKVLFLNSKNNGAGINLQEATDIILYHRLSGDLETQVVGRANRIGRKNNLFVHQLI
jgi:SNF2 family DNA or RNA helicase